MKRKINLEIDSMNYSVYQKALSVTAQRMVPTYFNCDSSSNQEYDAKEIGIMGCRTRVASNMNGKSGAKNRGNVACVTINLVQVAYRSGHELHTFYELLRLTMEEAKLLLLHRFKTLCEKADFTEIYLREYYLESKEQNAFEMLKNGTLAIGFIGVWDALSVLFNIEELDVGQMIILKKEAYKIIETMREFTDECSREENLNFSLLASAAEGVTGNFAEYDIDRYGTEYKVCRKGYYTNSFHVPVNIKLDYSEKINLEAEFHKLCNGGSITYIELGEMPVNNIEAVQEIIEYAYRKDCNYIGINFSMDYCRACSYKGRISKSCPKCNSSSVCRLRRVSGYLSEDNSFTTGKRKELVQRKIQAFGMDTVL